jgi:hypothetical protein
VRRRRYSLDGQPLASDAAGVEVFMRQQFGQALHDLLRQGLLVA